jgi:hypothetical protein
MAFMMPEHVKGLKKLMNEDKKQPRPLLDETQIEEMERLLHQSLDLGHFIEVTTWRDGFFNKRVCKVTKVNLIAKTIIFQDELDSIFKVSFFHITNVVTVS